MALLDATTGQCLWQQWLPEWYRLQSGSAVAGLPLLVGPFVLVSNHEGVVQNELESLVLRDALPRSAPQDEGWR